MSSSKVVIILFYYRFNIDTKYGRVALEATYKAIMGYEQPIVKPPAEYKGDFFKGDPISDRIRQRPNEQNCSQCILC